MQIFHKKIRSSGFILPIGLVYSMFCKLFSFERLRGILSFPLMAVAIEIGNAYFMQRITFW